MRSGARRFLVWAAGVLLAGTAVAAFPYDDWFKKRNDDSELKHLKAAYTACVKTAAAPAKGVVVLDVDSNGNVQKRLSAARAWMSPDSDYRRVEDILLEQFASDGTNVTLRLDAEDCFFIRTDKKYAGWVESNACIVARVENTAQEISLKGKNVYFSIPSGNSHDSDKPHGSSGFITIFSDPEVLIKFQLATRKKAEESTHEVF